MQRLHFLWRVGTFADEQELQFRDQRGIHCSANPFRKCILSYHQQRSRSRGLAEISDVSLTLKELAFITIEVGPLLCLSASCTRANPILHQCTAFVTGTHHACLSMVQPLLSLNMRLHYKLLIKSFCRVPLSYHQHVVMSYGCSKHNQICRARIFWLALAHANIVVLKHKRNGVTMSRFLCKSCRC